jgi:GNAT superfamily N-acetyltransferase
MFGDMETNIEKNAPRVQTATVVPFNPRYLSTFKSLNRQWIEEYFELESMDLSQLEAPQAEIVDLGGEIFFVLEGENAVGTCAMIPHGPATYELAKMAVAREARGKGYGDLLMRACIAWAKKKGAERIKILSNTELEAAIALYLKHGFQVAKLGCHPDYARCNIEMEMAL